MSSAINETKPSTATVSNMAKIVSSVRNQLKAGSGYLYDDAQIDYDQEFDPISGNPMTYDGAGLASTITNEPKI